MKRTAKWISIALLSVFCTSSALAKPNLVVSSGLNLLLPHTERAHVFDNLPISVYRAVYFSGINAAIATRWRWQHAGFAIAYTYLHNTLNEAVGRSGNINLSRTLEKGYLSSHNLLLNGYYFFCLQKRVQPYVALGMGAAYVKVFQSLRFQFISVTTINTGAIAFAYNVKAGIQYRINASLALDTEASYLNAFPTVGDWLGDRSSLSIGNMVLSISLVYSFT